ncbi:MAG TPA: hypothetical protein VF808_14400 [Ktedonobacterales bacterium]
MKDTSTPASARALGIVLLVAAAFIVVYWLVWFGNRNLVAAAHTDTYYAFVSSFPVPDVWLALSTALAGVLLVRGNPTAIFVQFLAGGVGIYNGLLAAIFDLENGVLVGRGGAGSVTPILELSLTLVTLALSSFGLGWAWRHRAWVTTA